MPPNKYSQGTKDILDSMMADAKLNPLRQRELRQVMQHGRAAAPRPRQQPPNRRARPFEDPLRGVALNPNLTHGHAKKPQAQILREENNFARPQFAGGGRVVNRDAEKSKLQDEWRTNLLQSKAQVPPAAVTAAPARSEAATLHSQISEEIEERQAFVQQMRAMGNTEHEAAMHEQIRERMGELKRVESLMKGDVATSG